MSNSSKIAIGVVVIIILGLIVWWYAGSNSAVPAPATPLAAGSQFDQTASASAAAAAIPVAGLSTSPQDTSDAALDKDLAAVSAQINGLSADNASVDSSVK